MNKTLLYLGLAFMVFQAQSQDNFNIELISNVSVNERGNDVWGYVDSTGTEYAIMGSLSNTWIWSLEDPANPIERAQIPGDGSTWRDIKSWKDHLYVTADSGDDGLLVIDMSMAPDSIRFQYIKPDIIVHSDTTALGPCHNLYIDENGYCYLAGCRITGARKAIVFDLNVDKWNPPVVGMHGNVPNGGEYAHDVYVKNNILYASEINQGQLGIYDVSRKDSLVLMGSQKTGFNFTHNAWTSTDQNYVFTTDERANAFVEAYDISDPADIKFLDRFQPLETQGKGVIPHNVHYYDGFIVTSFYTDGVVITDVSQPNNMIKVGSYDTYLGPDGGFSGCWGAYPFLPSGLLLASDINTGLYVLQASYVRAARLEGTITDVLTGNAINNAELIINTKQMNYASSAADGTYKTGIEDGGDFVITVTHPEYESFTTSATLVNGETTELHIQLNEIEKAEFRITVTDAITGELVPNANILLTENNVSTSYYTNEFGEVVELLPIKTYMLEIGSWGHLPQSFEVDGNLSTAINIVLEQGYLDDFNQDLGWISAGNARTGLWERGIPNGTVFNGQFLSPPVDIGTDVGEYCYVTGNLETTVGTDDDVDDGYVQLFSPSFDVSDFIDPAIQFNVWFNVGVNNTPPDDTLFVYLHENGDSIEIMRFDQAMVGWNDQSEISIKDLIQEGVDLRVSFYVEDKPESGHPVEAGVDAIRIVDNNPTSSTIEVENISYKIGPNPFNNELNLRFETSKMRKIQIVNEIGNLIWSTRSERQVLDIQLVEPAGIYFLSITDEDGNSYSQKIVKI